MPLFDGGLGGMPRCVHEGDLLRKQQEQDADEPDGPMAHHLKAVIPQDRVVYAEAPWDSEAQNLALTPSTADQSAVSCTPFTY